MLKIEKSGYHVAAVTEPLILEKSDYENDIEKWEFIKNICGFTRLDNVSKIKVNITEIEFFVD